MNKRRILLLAGPVVAVIIASYFYVTSGRYVSTENAFIKADKVIISPEISGSVMELHVSENQQVQKGDLLFRMDPVTYAANLEQAKAGMEKARSDIRALQAAYKAKQAELKLARGNLAFAEKEYRRQVNLAAKGFASQTLLDDRQHMIDVTRQQVMILEQELARVLASLNGDANAPVDQHPGFLAAKAEYDQANIRLQHTQLHAPFDGIATNVPKAGQYLNPGSPAMSIVADKGLWIEANFNETDLTYVKEGLPVTIHVDMYPDHAWKGVVESMSPATGAEFSILPPQNATGNWIKVVQRFPIRIHIEQQTGDPVLRAGMSAHVEIDTRPQG